MLASVCALRGRRRIQNRRKGKGSPFGAQKSAAQQIRPWFDAEAAPEFGDDDGIARDVLATDDTLVFTPHLATAAERWRAEPVDDSFDGIVLTHAPAQ